MKTRSINDKIILKKHQGRLNYDSLEKEYDFFLCRDYAKILNFANLKLALFLKTNFFKSLGHKNLKLST